MATLDIGLGHADRHAGLNKYCIGLMCRCHVKASNPWLHVLTHCTPAPDTNVKTLAQSLPDGTFQNIGWREGANGRLAGVRVLCAGNLG